MWFAVDLQSPSPFLLLLFLFAAASVLCSKKSCWHTEGPETPGDREGPGSRLLGPEGQSVGDAGVGSGREGTLGRLGAEVAECILQSCEWLPACARHCPLPAMTALSLQRASHSTSNMGKVERACFPRLEEMAVKPHLQPSARVAHFHLSSCPIDSG